MYFKNSSSWAIKQWRHKKIKIFLQNIQNKNFKFLLKFIRKFQTYKKSKQSQVFQFWKKTLQNQNKHKVQTQVKLTHKKSKQKHKLKWKAKCAK